LNDNTTQRDHLMAALSAAEHVVADAPTCPAQIRIESETSFGSYPGTYEPVVGVIAYFHRAPDLVAEFAAHFGVPALERPHGTDGMVYTYADGSVEGVPFRAWALSDASATVDTERGIPQYLEGVVAFRDPDRPGVLLCREHGDGWAWLVPLTSEDLPDGGICTFGDRADPADVCGRDVLIGAAAEGGVR
jgi:hypothetical protein